MTGCCLTGMGVEKLLRAKIAKTKSRQDALQKTFFGFLDIFYPPNFGCLGGNWTFSTPTAPLARCRALGPECMAMFQQLPTLGTLSQLTVAELPLGTYPGSAPRCPR
jgi:hypothetical protein